MTENEFDKTYQEGEADNFQEINDYAYELAEQMAEDVLSKIVDARMELPKYFSLADKILFRERAVKFLMDIVKRDCT